MRALISCLCLLVASAQCSPYLPPINYPWARRAFVARRGADLDTLVTSITELLEQAKKGIDTNELQNDAADIESAATELKGDGGGEENDEDVKKLIDDVASQFDGATAVSALFDGPLDFQASNLDSALRLLGGLADKTKELSASGKPVNCALTAIAMTAGAIQDITADVDSMVRYVAEVNQEEEGEKRSFNYRSRRGEFEFNVGYSGGSWSGGVSYKSG